MTQSQDIQKVFFFGIVYVFMGEGGIFVSSAGIDVLPDVRYSRCFMFRYCGTVFSVIMACIAYNRGKRAFNEQI